jgi:hypothetical protein
VIVSEPGDRPHYVDAGGHARRVYGEGALFVIRPDNYLGMATADPARAPVVEYLQSICIDGREYP